MGAEPSDSSSGSSPSRSTKGTLVPHFPPKATFSADLAADAGSSTPAAESPPARPRQGAHLTHLEEASAATWQSRLPGAPSAATNSNPSQMAQLPLPLAAVLVTSPRRTLPRRLVVWRQRLGLTGWRGNLLCWASPWQRARGRFREPWLRWAELGRRCNWEAVTWDP